MTFRIVPFRFPLDSPCKQTPRDPLRSAACVQQRIDLIRRNLGFMRANRLAGPGLQEGSE